MVLGSILLVVAIFAVSLYVHISKQINKPYSEIVFMNWNIKLPSQYKEIYSVDSGSSFQGDGPRYHVFQYKNEEDINQSLTWVNIKNDEIEILAEKVLNTLNISKEKKPDFENKYKYYIKEKEDSSKIYLIFFIDTKKLYIIEDIL